MANTLTLAAAGSRKTQGIVDACKTNRDMRTLVLTYTTANQCEIKSRLAQVGHCPNVRVSGWFSFLIRDIVRPYVPFVFRNKRLTGFDFSGNSTRLPNTSAQRYFTPDGSVRKAHLAQLAAHIEEASGGVGVAILRRRFDRIFIDEVQDLNGYDLECLAILLDSGIDIEMVGDIRQAIMVTNPQEAKNRQYKFMAVWNWFKLQEQRGKLRIEYKSDSWRCSAAICQFADSLFEPIWGFPPTNSMQTELPEHHGLFLVRTVDVPTYIEKHRPMFLRDRVTSGSYPGLSLVNIGDSKGATSDHVLIHPTGPVTRLLRQGLTLESQQAAKLYVAVTRAKYSVAFVVDAPGSCLFPCWTPS